MLAERRGSHPQGWSVRCIGEFATECKQRAGHDTDFSVLSVTKHYGIVRSDQFFRKRVHGRDTSNYKVVHPGQFAYATIHLNEGSIGRHRDSTPGIVSPMYTVFDVHDGIDPDYLFAVLKSERSLRLYEKITQGTVKRRGGISFRTLAGLRLHHPPLREQRKIAAILSSVDDAIEKTQAVIDQVQVVKRGLMQELLTRGLPGRHTRFKQTEIGEVPEKWAVVELASVASVERGKFAHRPRNEPRFYGGEYPFIQTGDVAACDGPIEKYSQTLNEEGLAVSRLFPCGTIIITIAANIGSTGIATFDVAFPDSLVGIQAGPRVDTRFLELVLRNRRHVLDQFAPESAQKNINLNTLKPLKIPLPEMSEQRKIAGGVWSIIMRLKEARAHLEGLTHVKPALMSVLLTGELRVIPDNGVT